MRLSGTKTGSANQYNGLGDQLYDLGGARPTLDLNFASNGSLVDSVTGKTLVTHTRASNATYVDGDGIIKDAVTNLLTYSEEFDQWVKTNTTIVSNVITAPNGTFTADRITENSATSQHYISKGASGIPASTPITISSYVKFDSADRNFSLQITDAPSGGSGYAELYLTQNGVITSPTPASFTNRTATVENVGNGWYRVRLTITTAAVTTITVRLFIVNASNNQVYSGDGASGVYIWGAQLEESSTVGEYVKTTSTINSAPRFDHKVTRTTTNLLTYSEEFDQSVWSKSNASITPNVVTTPNNTFTGDKLVENTANSTHYARQSVSVVNGTTYTASFYIKAGERSEIYSDLSGTVSGALVVYNASTDTFVSVGSGVSSHSSESVGNGWYRVKYTVTSQNTQSGFLQFYLYVDGTLTYTGDGTSGLYLWGAQLEQNSDVGPYVKTTGAAATKVDAEPLGLLVEESRTNLIPNGDQIGGTGWSNPGGNSSNLTTNNPSPTGENVASTWTGIGYYEVVSGTTNGTTYMMSVYAKQNNAGTDGFAALEFGSDSGAWGGGSDQAKASFNLATGTVIATQPGVVSAGIEDVGNGWYRCYVSGVKSGTGDIAVIVYCDNHGNGSSLYVWGAQVEVGSFPTSYIHTSGSTVTRSADVTSIEGNDFGTFNLAQYSEEFDNASWSTINATITSNQVIAPDGTLTADEFTEATPGTARVFQNVTVSAGIAYTASVFLKAGTNAQVFWREDYEDSIEVEVNLSTGTITNGSGVVTPVGDGWYKVSITGSVVGTIFRPELRVVNSPGTVFIWGAQLEESSTATPYVKSDVTWTSRASNATYYDYTGTLRKSSYNLLQRSEEFDNSDYVSIGNRATVTPNVFTSPTGALTADKIEFTAGDNRFYGLTPVSSTIGVTYTASIYIYSTVSQQLELILVSGAGLVTIKVVDVAIGWNRYQVSRTANTSTMFFELATVGDGSLTSSSRPASSGNIYIWGAQVETGPYAGDYAKTEGSAASSARNVAFLPDGSGNFVSAGELLLEDAGTNGITYSEEFDQIGGSGWNASSISAFGSGSVANATTAPDGKLTADKIAAASGTVGPRYFQNTTGSGEWTYSIYAKAAEADCFFIGVYTGSIYEYLYYDLTNESVIAATASKYSVVNVGNGWFRLSVTATTTSPYGNISFGLADDTFSQFYVNFTSDGTDGIYVWGAQLEESPYPTSYIPTYGSTATRAADVSSSSSNTFGNSFYNQTEGTVFSDSRHKAVTARTLAFTDGTYNNAMQQYLLSNTAAMDSYISNSWQGSGGANITFVSDQQFKVISTIQTDSGVTVADGTLGTVDTSYGIPTVDRLLIGQSRSSDKTNGHISRLTYWPTRLNNDTLQTITV